MIYVNGERVGPEDVELEKRLMMEHYKRQRPSEELEKRMTQLDEDARENAVERALLVQEARRRHPDVPAVAVRKMIEDWRKNLERQGRAAPMNADEKAALEAKARDDWRFSALIEEVESTARMPTEEECRAYYEANLDAFITEERVRAAHMVKRPSPGQPPGLLIAELLNVREALLNGADFAEMAEKHSQCSDAGGDLGWIPRGVMVQAFDEAVFDLETGVVSDVFATEFGYHLAMVSARQPAEKQSFEDVRYEIETTLLHDRTALAREEFVIQLREAAEIKEVEEQPPAEHDEDTPTIQGA